MKKYYKWMLVAIAPLLIGIASVNAVEVSIDSTIVQMGLRGMLTDGGKIGTLTFSDDSEQSTAYTGAGGALGSNLSSTTNDILSDTGTVILGGTGGSNNNNLTFDFESSVNAVNINTTTGAFPFFQTIVIFTDNKNLQFGASNDSGIRWDVGATIDSWQYGVKVGSNDQSGYMSIMEFSDMGHANRDPSAFALNPTLRGYSADETGAIDYWEIYHDGTDAVYDWATGDLIFENTSGAGVQFKGIADSDLVHVNPAGNDRVGIGTSTPGAKLTVQGFIRIDGDDGGSGKFACYAYSDTAWHVNSFDFRRTRGTKASPTAVTNSDDIFSIAGRGHDGTDDSNLVGSILCEVDGATGTDDTPGRITFSTTADGANTVTEAVRIDSSQNVGMGTSSPVSGLETANSRGSSVTVLNAATLTLDDTHDYISVQYTLTGTVAITLSSATSAWNSTDGIGREYTIKDADCNAGTNNITINRAGSDTITDTATAQTSTIIAGNGGAIHIRAVSATTWEVY